MILSSRSNVKPVALKYKKHHYYSRNFSSWSPQHSLYHITEFFRLHHGRRLLNRFVSSSRRRKMLQEWPNSSSSFASILPWWYESSPTFSTPGTRILGLPLMQNQDGPQSALLSMVQTSCVWQVPRRSTGLQVSFISALLNHPTFF